ncbi:PilZ domain-containing protein [Lysinibacillus composti]|uniref:PilZ domain-containing protein n=2 Tax=Lysinibacillus composti TaxID=720633 RepID=A0A3N9UCN0_9BACI|nr:PilZ domain-containing protein [Lysinibacillus composti]
MDVKGESVQMIFKREEAFRYIFGFPIPAEFTITQINYREVNSSPGMAEIIDISPEGLRIRTNLLIPDEDAKIVLSVTFKINEVDLTVDGEIIWAKEMGSLVEYGIHLLVDASMKNMIIEELKVYSKSKN